MLSATNTINDIKAKLINDYGYYGYASDSAFIAALTTAVADAKLELLYPILMQGNIGIYNTPDGYYDYIAAKDKVGLTLAENYIYKAEVYFSCAQFMKDFARAENQSNLGDSESISVEGYSRSVSGGITGKTAAIDEFMKEARKCLAQAEYKTGFQLQRGNSSLESRPTGLNGGFY